MQTPAYLHLASIQKVSLVADVASSQVPLVTCALKIPLTRTTIYLLSVALNLAILGHIGTALAVQKSHNAFQVENTQNPLSQPLLLAQARFECLRTSPGTVNGEVLPPGSYPTLLQLDDRGSEVTDLQQRLNDKGYSVAVDGVYGGETEAAVRRFQSDNGILVDGKAGTQTLSALDLSYTDGSSSGTRAKGYVVVVPVRNDRTRFQTLRQVRRYAYDACLANDKRGRYVLSGTFRSYSPAQDLTKTLRSNDLDARVVYFH